MLKYLFETQEDVKISKSEWLQTWNVIVRITATHIKIYLSLNTSACS